MTHHSPVPLKIADRAKTALVIVLMLLFWGSAYVGIRAGLAGYSPGSLALFRYLVASVCMLGIYLRFCPRRQLSWKEFWLAALAGILGFSIYSVTLNMGEVTVNAGVASFIISQIPVVITLLALIFLGESLSLYGWLGTGISILGIFLIMLSQYHGGELNRGMIFILIATLTGGIYAFLQKPLLRTMHPIEFTAIAIWMGTFAMLIYLPNLWHELPRAPLTATIWVVYIGIFPAAIAYVLWAYILAKMPAAKAASYLYIVPGITLVLGWLFLNEIPHLLAIFGGLLALAGTWLVKRGVIIKSKNLTQSLVSKQ